MAIRPLSQFDLQSAFAKLALQFVDAQPRFKYNADQNAEHVQDVKVVDGQSLPLWECDLLAKDEDGGFGSLSVRIAAKEMPTFPPMTICTLTKPMGTAWVGSNQGQGGFSVRAEGIRAVPAVAAAPEAKKPAA